MADAAKPLRLGGMALANGLLVHGPGHWSAAIRGSDGEIAVASGAKPRLRSLARNIPGLRGLAGMAEAVAVIPLVRRALPEARLPFESASVLATAGAAALAGTALRRRGSEAAALFVSLAPSLMALRSGDVAAYHGAEHKTIGAYESGTEDHSKEHDRCGSHLMAPLLIANAAGLVLLRRAGDHPSQLASSAVSMASFGAAVEIFAWSERHHDSPAARALRIPGHELQRVIGTREPTADQLAVGRAALDEILRVEKAA
ncbi:MAG: hypothetical protein QOG68_1402 [Solirubrobacteraceae bacterium]|nr:hypothetical protein [Solirubrobacteraceae bacterium]